MGEKPDFIYLYTFEQTFYFKMFRFSFVFLCIVILCVVFCFCFWSIAWTMPSFFSTLILCSINSCHSNEKPHSKIISVKIQTKQRNLFKQIRNGFSIEYSKNNFKCSMDEKKKKNKKYFIVTRWIHWILITICIEIKAANRRQDQPIISI